MTNETKLVHNVQTGEIEILELTDKEQEIKNAESQASINAKAEKIAELQELRLTKISAYEKLGLTATEIEALLPTPVEPIVGLI
jgi:hypothetical protein